MIRVLRVLACTALCGVGAPLGAAAVEVPPSVASEWGDVSYTSLSNELVGAWMRGPSLETARLRDGSAAWGGRVGLPVGAVGQVRVAANRRGDVVTAWRVSDMASRTAAVFVSLRRARASAEEPLRSGTTSFPGSTPYDTRRALDVVAEEDGTFTLAWQEPDGTVWARSRRAGDAQWSEPVRISGDRPGAAGMDDIAVVATPGGGTTVAWSTGTGAQQHIVMAHRSASGWTVDTATAQAEPGIRPDAARRADGTAVIVWSRPDDASAARIAVRTAGAGWTVQSATGPRGDLRTNGTRTVLFASFAANGLWVRDRDNGRFRAVGVPFTAISVAVSRDGSVYAVGADQMGSPAWATLPPNATQWTPVRYLVRAPRAGAARAMLVPRAEGGVDLLEMLGDGADPHRTALTPNAGRVPGATVLALARRTRPVDVGALVSVQPRFVRYGGPVPVTVQARVGNRWVQIGRGRVERGGMVPVRFPRVGTTMTRLVYGSRRTAEVAVRVRPTALREVPAGERPSFIHIDGRDLWVVSGPLYTPNGVERQELRLFDATTGRLRRIATRTTGSLVGPAVMIDGTPWMRVRYRPEWVPLDAGAGGLVGAPVAEHPAPPCPPPGADCEGPSVEVNGVRHTLGDSGIGPDGARWGFSADPVAEESDQGATGRLTQYTPDKGWFERGAIGPFIPGHGMGDAIFDTRAVAGGIWVRNLNGQRYWAGTPGGPVTEMRGHGAMWLDGRGTWVLRRTRPDAPITLARWDATTGTARTVARVPMSGSLSANEGFATGNTGFDGLAVGRGVAWVLNDAAGTLVRVPLPATART